MARQEKAQERAAVPEAPVPHTRRVPAPAGVAVILDEVTEVARKVAGYHVRAGQALEMMAAEVISGLPARAGPSAEAVSGQAPPGGDRGAGYRAGNGSVLGDHEELRREPGPGWEAIHRDMERLTGLWSELPKDLPEVILTGAPPDDAGAHERVQFYSAVMGRLDAVRGRLLRVVEDRRHAGRLRFSGLGQYVRERMGLSFREARDLIRLDRALTD
ncbi:MAG: hypothetical protein L0Y64_25265, partial [Myxococcaceae bacterium]|nr:hypothetical protein [Myxococcaceae bacterium]